jgi:UDP-N-acetylglucosamine 2-epimerase
LSSEVEEIRFCLHPPTEHYLNKYKLKSHLLEIDNLSILPIQPYDKFLKLIVGAKFVITDGGSIQEECQTLNKLCIIFRSTTERDNGLLNNAVMTTFSATKDLDALNQLSPKVTKNDQDFKASDIIINSLESA